MTSFLYFVLPLTRCPRNSNPKSSGPRKERRAFDASKLPRLSKAEIEVLNEDWDDREETSAMWEIISQGMIREFIGVLMEDPSMAHVRSSDGRGPLWWAHEYNRPKMIEILKAVGVSENLRDKNGVRPKDL